MQSDEGDRRIFYKLISMLRGIKTDLTDEMIINGKIVSGQTLIDDLLHTSKTWPHLKTFNCMTL